MNPQPLETGADAAMERYALGLYQNVDALINSIGAQPGFVDRQWPTIAQAIRACAAWDNHMLEYLDMYQSTCLRRSLDAKYRMVAAGRISTEPNGWEKLRSFLDKLRFEPLPFERDWTSGPLDLQHAAAIPIVFDWRSSLYRIHAVVENPAVDEMEVFRKLGNLFNNFTMSRARDTGHPLEIMTADIVTTLLSRNDMLVDWSFTFVTYFGQPGVGTYNAFVSQLPIAEANIIKFFNQGGRQS